MYDSYCLSSFLALRYVYDAQASWKENVRPQYPAAAAAHQVPVRNVSEIDAALQRYVCGGDNVGILLSAGIDSAIVASYMPEGTKAYTIRFRAPGAIDESIGAAAVAQKLCLRHTVVDVSWEDCEKNMDALMLRKKSPLHPIEVALNKAARVAAADGVNTLIVGNGADSTFGGMDKLLARDWTLDEFITRYTFVDPAAVLKKNESMRAVFAAYGKNPIFDVQGFLKTVHGIGILQSFETALAAAGCGMIAPFEEMYLDVPLDIELIRSGRPKYLLQQLFAARFAGVTPARKIPFARPTDYWMQKWQGPVRPEFVDSLDMSKFSGEKKWLMYILERFLNLFDGVR